MKEYRIFSAYELFRYIYDGRHQAVPQGMQDAVHFYRGHSSKAWNLLPSLAREGLNGLERELVDEFRRIRPDEFPESLRLLDTLAKMRHYGMSSRLLDVTANPAVALYFACADANQGVSGDGEVFFFLEGSRRSPDPELIGRVLEISLTRTGALRGAEPQELLDALCSPYPLFIRPRIINERMHRQSGGFLLFLNVFNQQDSIITQKIEDITEKHIHRIQKGIRYIVDGESKKRILGELEMIGIHESFLFPELQYESKRILTHYKNIISAKE